MMIGYFDYAVPTQTDSKLTAKDRIRTALATAVRLKKFDELDKDGDGELSQADTPLKLRPVFKSLDANKDGTLTRSEAAAGK